MFVVGFSVICCEFFEHCKQAATIDSSNYSYIQKLYRKNETQSVNYNWWDLLLKTTNCCIFLAFEKCFSVKSTFYIIIYFYLNMLYFVDGFNNTETWIMRGEEFEILVLSIFTISAKLDSVTHVGNLTSMHFISMNK